MKKIFILLPLLFLLTGCFDYHELNDLAIISGIGIDYQNQEYILSLEVLNNKKQGEDSTSTTTTIIESKGKTISEAFSQVSIDKTPYYEHLDIVIISKDITDNTLQEVCDYLIRSVKLRNEFYLVISKNNTPNEILNNTSKDNPIASTYIVGLLEQSNQTNNQAYYVPFTKTLSDILTKGIDARLSAITLNNNNIELNGIAVYKDYSFITYLDNNTSIMINLLDNFQIKEINFQNECINLNIYQSKLSIKETNQNIKIEAKMQGNIKENTCSYNLREEKTYEELERQFTSIITNELNNTMLKIKDTKTDILGIGKSYYNTSRIKDYNKWLYQDIIYDIDLKINKKGLTFELGG